MPQTACMVFPFLSPQDNLLPVLFCLWRCVTCSCESRNPDVFLDSSPPQHTPGQVLVDAHPYISFYSIHLFSPPLRSPAFLFWITARTSSLVSVTVGCSPPCSWEDPCRTQIWACHSLLYLFINFLYCSGFCHPLTWISHGFTCVPHHSSL